MRLSRWWICLSLVITGLAHADSKPDPRAEAKAHYEKGVIAFDLHHFDEAAAEYEAAYKAKPDPALLYNLGQALRLAGRYEGAAAAYQSFLRRMPQSPQRAEVEARIEEMHAAEKEAQARATRERMAAEQKAAEDKLAQEKAAQEQAAQRAAQEQAAQNQSARRNEDRRRWRTLKWAGLGLGVGGAVLAVTGAGLYGAGQAAYNRINSPADNASFDPSDERRMNTLRPTGIALLSIGVVAAAGGFALFGVSHTKERAADKITAYLPATGASFTVMEGRP